MNSRYIPASVRITMYFHVNLLMEPFPTVGTAVSLKARVGTHMGMKV